MAIKTMNSPITEQIKEYNGKLYHEIKYKNAISSRPIDSEEAAHLSAMWGGRDHWDYTKGLEGMY